MAETSYQEGKLVRKRKPEFLGYYWEGKSAIDGAPIILVFTFHSRNAKTGAMIQTWVLRADISPLWAVRTGADYSICGMCKFRHFLGGKCYVVWARAPLSVYKAFLRGRYEKLDLNRLERFHSRFLRIGSFGDPAMVPANIWQTIIAKGKLAGRTGYTHQWSASIGASLKGIVMASVDSVSEFWQAESAGWKCFRSKERGDPVVRGENVCPASAEAGHKTTCFGCHGCYGNGGHKVINIHGFMVRERN